MLANISISDVGVSDTLFPSYQIFAWGSLGLISQFFYQANLEVPLKTRRHQSHGGSSDDLALNYFSMVNESRTRLLYEVYKKDFLMFDYDPTPFFKVSRKED